MVHTSKGLPGGAGGKEPACQCQTRKIPEFDPWIMEIPCRRAWQPTAALLPRESHGQRSLAGCCPQGLKDSDMIECLTVHFFIFHDRIPFFVCLSTTYQNISILCQS